jgi:hypothetical protein
MRCEREATVSQPGAGVVSRCLMNEAALGCSLIHLEPDSTDSSRALAAVLSRMAIQLATRKVLGIGALPGRIGIGRRIESRKEKRQKGRPALQDGSDPS